MSDVLIVIQNDNDARTDEPIVVVTLMQDSRELRLVCADGHAATQLVAALMSSIEMHSRSCVEVEDMRG